MFEGMNKKIDTLVDEVKQLKDERLQMTSSHAQEKRNLLLSLREVF